MKNLKILLALICLLGGMSTYGELPPSRAWWQKIGFTAYNLYRSSDLIGEGYVEAVEELPPGSFPLGPLKLTVVFTNTIKGSPGKYEVIMPDDLRETKGYYVPPPKLGARIDLNRFSPISQMIDTNGAYCGKPGQSFTMVCEDWRRKTGALRLHALIPADERKGFVAQLAESKRRHEAWVKKQEARQLEIEITQLKLQDKLELGDITQEEYDRQHEQLEPLLKESDEIDSQLWEDRAGYRYYNEEDMKKDDGHE